MDAKTDESHGAVAGQVERSVRPLAPMRAWKVFVRGWGDAPAGWWAGPLPQPYR